MVEIKHLSSEGARTEVLEALRGRGNWKAMATPERFSRTFPSDIREDWRGKVSVSRGGACSSRSPQGEPLRCMQVPDELDLRTA